VSEEHAVIPIEDTFVTKIRTNLAKAMAAEWTRNDLNGDSNA
jgi:hypothetical protein